MSTNLISIKILKGAVQIWLKRHGINHPTKAQVRFALKQVVKPEVEKAQTMPKWMQREMIRKTLHRIEIEAQEV